METGSTALSGVVAKVSEETEAESLEESTASKGVSSSESSAGAPAPAAVGTFTSQTSATTKPRTFSAIAPKQTYRDRVDTDIANLPPPELPPPGLPPVDDDTIMMPPPPAAQEEEKKEEDESIAAVNEWLNSKKAKHHKLDSIGSVPSVLLADEEGMPPTLLDKAKSLGLMWPARFLSVTAVLKLAFFKTVAALRTEEETKKVDQAVLSGLTRFFRPVQMRSGKTIYNQGDQVRSGTVFLVVEGEISLVRDGLVVVSSSETACNELDRN